MGRELEDKPMDSFEKVVVWVVIPAIVVVGIVLKWMGM